MTMAYKRKKDGVYLNPKDGKLYEHKGYATRIFWSRQMLDDLRRLFPVTPNEELAGYFGVSLRTLIRKAREINVAKDPEWLAKTWDRNRDWAHMAARRKGYPGAFEKGVRANPETEFKPGHQLTEEQRERKNKHTRDYWTLHRSEARAKSLKAWETRRSRTQQQIENNSIK